MTEEEEWHKWEYLINVPEGTLTVHLDDALYLIIFYWTDLKTMYPFLDYIKIGNKFK